MVDEKRCPQCKEIKMFSEFYKNKSRKDGLSVYCKSCIKINSHNYHKTHKDLCKERLNKWRNQNREYVRERDKNYRQEHLEQEKAKDKKYRDSHKEKIAEKGRKYRETHKDYFYNKARERKNNQLKRSDGTITLDTELKILEAQNYLCDYCGDDISKKKHLDHILPLDKGGLHTITNIHFTCSSCNLSKGAKLEEEWFEWLKIHRKQKYEKIMNYKKVKNK